MRADHSKNRVSCDSDLIHQNSIAYEILWHVIIILEYQDSTNLDKNFIVFYIF